MLDSKKIANYTFRKQLILYGGKMGDSCCGCAMRDDCDKPEKKDVCPECGCDPCECDDQVDKEDEDTDEEEEDDTEDDDSEDEDGEE